MFKNVYLLKCIIQVLTEVFQKSVPELLQVIKSVVGSIHGIDRLWDLSGLIPIPTCPLYQQCGWPYTNSLPLTLYFCSCGMEIMILPSRGLYQDK